MLTHNLTCDAFFMQYLTMVAYSPELTCCH